jgi:hypothetical protein
MQGSAPGDSMGAKPATSAVEQAIVAALRHCHHVWATFVLVSVFWLTSFLLLQLFGNGRLQKRKTTL